MQNGYLKTHRKFFEHWLWKEKRVFSKAEAWLDLLRRARWQAEPEKTLFMGELIEIKRGQLVASVRFLATAWRWGSNDKVDRFLKILKADGMISTDYEHKTGRITICKYDTYNQLPDDDGTMTGQQRDDDGTMTGQILRTKKNNKKGEEGGEGAALPAFDLIKKIGQSGAQLWVQTGIETQLTEAQAATCLEWLSYRQQKGIPLKTSNELYQLLQTAKENTPARFSEMVHYSAGNGYTALFPDFDKKTQKNGNHDRKPDYRQFWSTGH